MKRLDLINKRLREKNEARLHFNNVDKAMLEHYQVFAKQTKPLPPEPQLSDFYHPSEDKKIANYCFLQWVQAWQHIPYTGTLNK